MRCSVLSIFTAFVLAFVYCSVDIRSIGGVRRVIRISTNEIRTLNNIRNLGHDNTNGEDAIQPPPSESPGDQLETPVSASEDDYSFGQPIHDEDYYKYDDDNFDDDDGSEYYAYLEEKVEDLSSIKRDGIIAT